MPTKQFCLRGHDTFIFGRSPNGRACRECARIKGRSRRNKNRNQYRINYRQQNWKRHKVKNEEGKQFTYLDYDRLYQIQGGRCAFPGCNRHQSEIKESLNVDHAHDTGMVRSLLCNSCNKNLVSHHTIETTERLLQYLKKFNAIR